MGSFKNGCDEERSDSLGSTVLQPDKVEENKCNIPVTLSKFLSPAVNTKATKTTIVEQNASLAPEISC